MKDLITTIDEIIKYGLQSNIIESNKERSSKGYVVDRESRKSELARKQDNANAILLDNQKAQEKMLKDIENLGWRLESRELLEGSDGEGTSKRYKYVFASLILDERGSPTEIWDGPSGGYGQFPNTHPVGWAEKDLIYPNGEKIPDEIIANELARNQTPNNWMSSYVNIFQEFQKVMYRKKVMEEAKQRAEQGIEESNLRCACALLAQDGHNKGHVTNVAHTKQAVTCQAK